MLGRLVVRTDSVPRILAAGDAVSVRGEWVRLGRPSPWPRRPGRTGIVVGRLVDSGRASNSSISSGEGPVVRALHGARARASNRLRRLLPPDASAVGRALILAERDDIPGSLRSRFAEAGLAHLLAISGLHVGLIGVTVAMLLGLLMRPGRAAICSAAVVALYVAAIGAPASAVRAALLLAGWAAARARGRPARSWDLLGAAALLALVADPLVLGEAGFQLSFAGFIGLGAGVTVARSLGDAGGSAPGLFRRRMRRLPRRFRRRLSLLGTAVAAGTGAFLATAPISATHFQHVAPSALLSHFAGAPLVGAAIGALAMTLVLPPPLDGVSAEAAASVIRLLTMVAGAISDIPGSHFIVRPPSAVSWVAIVLALVGLWRFLKWGRPVSSLVPLGAAAALVLAAPALSIRLADGRSILCTLDVGQGDAAILRTGAGRWILFDAGPRFGSRDAGRDVVLPMLRRYGASRIDLFVLSHPDLDHVGGFDAIHEAIPVFRVLDSGHPIPKPGYARFLARTEEDGILWLVAERGDRVTLDDVAITVLGPARATEDGTGAANETSLQLRVSIGGGFTYVNTGDATKDDERVLLSVWPVDSLRADLLKVGHHGSRTATGDDWLSAVDPAVAVISSGRGNSYGHPHISVLERLAAASVPRVWRTDREGTLCLEVDREKGWRVRGERGWREPSTVARVLTSQRGDK